jgi:hypothetical protein
MQAVLYVLVDVSPCHPGELIRYYTQYQQTDGPQYRHVDVHSENSIKKNCKDNQ